MLQKILVPLDDSESGATALSIAANLTAVNKQCELLGVFVEDIRQFLKFRVPYIAGATATGEPVVPQPVAPNELAAQQERIERERERFKQEFREACGEASIIGRFFSPMGEPHIAIVDFAKQVDLLVLGSQRDEAFGEDKIAEHVLKNTACPVLVVPPTTFGLNRMLLAYDGEPSSSRAMRFSADFASMLEVEEVFVLTVADQEDDAREIQRPALEYLSSYPFQTKGDWRKGDVAEEIAACALQTQSSLVVLGAYGSSVLSRLLSGSKTNKVLNQPDVATLVVP